MYPLQSFLTREQVVRHAMVILAQYFQKAQRKLKIRKLEWIKLSKKLETFAENMKVATL